MSVPQGERGETKLAVIDVAENLAVYTIQCVTNENHFPKRYRWCFTKEISDKAIEVDYLLHGANGVYPTTISDRKKRIERITDALVAVGELLALIALAKKAYGIKLDGIAYWLETATYEKTLIQKWKTSEEAMLKDELKRRDDSNKVSIPDKESHNGE
jgi:hypothetical protein